MSTAPNAPALPRAAAVSPLGARINEEQDGLTAREHAAIVLRVPNSGSDWLDTMIRTAQRYELTKEAMAAIVGGITASRNAVEDKHLPGLAVMAGKIADAMLAGAATPKGE